MTDGRLCPAATVALHLASALVAEADGGGGRESNPPATRVAALSHHERQVRCASETTSLSYFRTSLPVLPGTNWSSSITALKRIAPDLRYTVADLARIAGTSARSLQYAFHERYNTTPMRYLREVRLDRAREDLGQIHGSVADIAYYWGFANPGRFARAYRDRFGEFPADTLEAGRTHKARH